jgi:hypothetical protein
MSYNPPESPRPRSTPIPDPDQPGGSMAPPTPEEFLRQQTPQPGGQQGGQMPTPPPTQWMPTAPPPPPGQPAQPQNQYQQPQQQQQQPMGGYTVGPGAPGWGQMGGRIPMRTLSGVWIARTIVGLIIACVGLFIGWRAYNRANDAVDRATRTTFPAVVIPTFPTITVPHITIPTVTIPGQVLPVDTTPTGTGPLSTGPVATTAPVEAPPATVATGIPGGAVALWDTAATGPLMGQFEQSMAGDPTEFTMVVLYPDYAVASAQDPANPTKTVGSVWRAGAFTGFPGTPSNDIASDAFTTADVNWDAIGGLVAQAPALLNVPGNAVTHVIVQRWVFDPTLPLRVLVYVDGAGYVEASADGQVVATH